MKNAMSIRLNDLTKAQLDELTERFAATQASIVSTAIDRMYQQEIKIMKPTNLMTVGERNLHEAVYGVKLPPQTDAEFNEALRLAAVEAWRSKDERGLLPGPKTPNNINYMPPEIE